MEPVLFVMAILGCGEGNAPCDQITVARSRYESRADCVAATATELPRYQDALYPVVVADCREAGTAPQRLRASDFALPEPEQHGLRVRPRFAERPGAAR